MAMDNKRKTELITVLDEYGFDVVSLGTGQVYGGVPGQTTTAEQLTVVIKEKPAVPVAPATEVTP